MLYYSIRLDIDSNIHSYYHQELDNMAGYNDACVGENVIYLEKLPLK